MIPLVYAHQYNITAFGLERMHPFDSRKYRRIHDWLIHQGLRKPRDFSHPLPISSRDLLRVHSAEYLKSLRSRQLLARILEVPLIARLPAWVINWRVLRPMRYTTAGTVLACRLALQHGVAVNLGGGFHHASGSRGGGFCVYADAPLALHILREEGLIRTALVIDTDAHQGDGTADAIRDWPWASIVDFYEDDIFPWPKVEENVPVPLSPRTAGSACLELLREYIPAALDRFAPDFVLYNAGSDVLRTDPLAQLNLSPQDMAERDLMVVSEARSRGIPVAMVLSGGYGPLSWEAHAQSIEGILTRFDKE